MQRYLWYVRSRSNLVCNSFLLICFCKFHFALDWSGPISKGVYPISVSEAGQQCNLALWVNNTLKTTVRPSCWFDDVILLKSFAFKWIDIENLPERNLLLYENDETLELWNKAVKNGSSSSIYFISPFLLICHL